MVMMPLILHGHENIAYKSSSIKRQQRHEKNCFIYADDTTLIIDVSESSFSISLSLLDTFVLIYGLKVNCEKTEAFWILLYKNWETTISSSKPIIWGKRYGFQHLMTRIFKQEVYGKNKQTSKHP